MALNQPLSLLELTSCAAGSFIGNHTLLIMKNECSETENVSHDNNKELVLNIKKQAEYYDAIIPQTMHNLITYYALQFMNRNRVQVPKNDFAFEIVLRSHVTKLDISDWPSKMHPMLYRNLSKLKYLKLLKGVNLENENLSCVVEGIKVMKHLETFQCEDCNDDLIKLLCDNCPLRSLNTVGGCITDSSVKDFLKLHNLEELNIIKARISKVGCKQLLCGLPNLKTLNCSRIFGVVPEDDIVTSFGSDVLTTLENVQLMCLNQHFITDLTDFCPSVKNLRLCGISDMITSQRLDFSNVANLNHLTTLYITTPYFHGSNISIILQRRGRQITDLALSGMRDVSLAVLLSEINTSCPNLKFLLIMSNDMQDVVCPTDIQKVFQNLESVDLTFNKDVTSCFIYLLCACVNIRKVCFGLVKELCDEDIDRILSSNSLTYLQELYIDQHKLTIRSIYRLLSSCGELRYIGNTGSRWIDRSEGITDLELEEFRNYTKENNLNVQFVNDWKVLERKKHVSVMKT